MHVTLYVTGEKAQRMPVLISPVENAFPIKRRTEALVLLSLTLFPFVVDVQRRYEARGDGGNASVSTQVCPPPPTRPLSLAYVSA